jgi:hypothetical protein
MSGMVLGARTRSSGQPLEAAEPTDISVATLTAPWEEA